MWMIYTGVIKLKYYILLWIIFILFSLFIFRFEILCWVRRKDEIQIIQMYLEISSICIKCIIIVCRRWKYEMLFLIMFAQCGYYRAHMRIHFGIIPLRSINYIHKFMLLLLLFFAYSSTHRWILFFFFMYVFFRIIFKWNCLPFILFASHPPNSFSQIRSFLVFSFAFISYRIEYKIYRCKRSFVNVFVNWHKLNR